MNIITADNWSFTDVETSNSSKTKSDISEPVIQTITWDIIKAEKMSILEIELRNNKLPLFFTILLFALGCLSALITKYWAILVLATLPVALHYAEHEVTLLSAKRRITHAKREE